MKQLLRIARALLCAFSVLALLFSASARDVLILWKYGKQNYEIPIEEVDSITISSNNALIIYPSEVEMFENDTLHYSVNLSTLDGDKPSYQDCDWETSDSAVAYFDTNVGRIMPVSAGRCVITAMYEGMKAECFVNVKKIIRESIYFCDEDGNRKDTFNIPLFGDGRFRLTTTSGNNVSDYADYISSDSSVAEIGSDWYRNVIIPVSVGECEITASYDGMTAKCHIVIEDDELKFCEGDTMRYTASYLRRNGRYERKCGVCIANSKGESIGWKCKEELIIKSTDVDVAKAFYYDSLYLYSNGECDIICSLRGKVVKQHIIVGGADVIDEEKGWDDKVDTITASSFYLTRGENIRLGSHLLLPITDDYDWVMVSLDSCSITTTDSKVATIDSSNKIRLHSVGECDIIVKYESYEVKVHLIVKEDNIYFYGNYYDQRIDTLRTTFYDDIRLFAKAEIGATCPIKYDISDEKVLTYDGETFISTGVGECDVVATCEGKTAKCHVVIEKGVCDLSFEKDTIECYADNDYYLAARFACGNADLSFSSTNNKVAYYHYYWSGDGFVQPVGIGECDVIVSYKDKSATCHVIVKGRPIVDINGTQIDMLSLKTAEVYTRKLYLQLPDGNMKSLDSRTAISSDPSVVVFGTDNSIIAQGVGECDIDVEYNEYKAKLHIIVSE